MSTHPIKEEVYMVYTEGDPNIAIHEKGMDERMPTNDRILATRGADIEEVDLVLARSIWEMVRNPRIVTNDPSHPNNWNAFDLVKIAKEIRKYDNRP